METKLLDLNAYGVEEIDSTEMRETDGGLIKVALVVVAAASAVSVALDLTERIGFRNGLRCSCQCTL